MVTEIDEGCCVIVYAFCLSGLFDTRRGWLFSLIPNENDCTLAIVVLMIMIFITSLCVLLRLLELLYRRVHGLHPIHRGMSFQPSGIYIDKNASQLVHRRKCSNLGNWQILH